MIRTQGMMTHDPKPGLRVAHITEAPMGGVLGCIHEIINQQASFQDVHAIYAVVPHVNVATLEADAPPCLEIRPYRHRRGSPAALLRLAASTIRLVRERRPDIVHVHSTIAGVVVRLTLLLCFHRPHVVYSPHCWAFLLGSPDRLAARAARVVERLLARTADCIVCVSEYEKVAAVGAGIPAARCVVIQNGISDIAVEDSDAALPKRVCKLQTLFVGRFDDQKGFDIYLEAMRRLAGSATGIAVGSFIVQKPAALNVPENVRLVPWCSREKLQDFYRDADLLVMPSRIESSPLVALEAMRAGLPVIATRAGGIPEIVVDYETGRLFESGDVDGLVKILRAITHSQISIYGKNSYARFKSHFTARRMASALMIHYRQPGSARDVPLDLCAAE